MLTQAAGPSGHQRLDNITPAPAYRYYFSGRHVLSAVLDNLEATADLKGASLVVLTGNSAGGFGVYSNVDYLQARYTGGRGTDRWLRVLRLAVHRAGPHLVVARQFPG